MLTETDLRIPIVVWGKSPPKHHISCLYITDNGKHLVTGCFDGQICTWDIEQDEIRPRYIFVGHNSNVLCMLNFSDNCIISSSEDGVMCVWDIADGFSSNVMKLQYVHNNMQLFERSESNDALLFCSGYYSDILAINPFTLEIIFSLHSVVNSDWISCFHVQKSKHLNTDVVLGLTITGTIKLWLLKKEDVEYEMLYECESKNLNCPNAECLKYDPSQKCILIVCPDFWQIYDTNFFTCICSNTAFKNEKFLGGDFYSSDKVILWSDNGKCYVYEISNKGSQSNVLCHIFEAPVCSKVFTTIIGFKSLENDKYVVSGDAEGNICFWKSSNDIQLSSLPNQAKNSLEDFWKGTLLFDILQMSHNVNISVSIYISGLNKLVFGCNDGSIIIKPAIATIITHIFNVEKENIDCQFIVGHKGRVNVLLYPNQLDQSYDESFLVSGGSDFSVCIWNIFTGSLIHKFCVHSGEITQLIVPPSNCKIRIQKCICTVASDHSVALLSLVEKKCVILASNHVFPISSINWRPLDDFIVVECCDGSVYIWEMETGHLDRVLTGLNAQEVLSACQDSSNDDSFNPVIQYFRGTKNRITEICVPAKRTSTKLFNGQSVNDSMLIDELKLNGTMLGFILYFNVESIISELYLLSKENKCIDLFNLNNFSELTKLTQTHSFELSKIVANTIEKFKIETENIQNKFQNDKNTPKEVIVPKTNVDMINKITQLLLSFLHCWGLNSKLDDICREKLSLLQPLFTTTSGIVSNKGNLSICLPGHETFQQTTTILTNSPVYVVNHFCAVSALTNTLSTINNVCVNETICKGDLECLVKNNKDLMESNTIKRPKIEFLAQIYLNECVEVRNVAQNMLIQELEVLGTEKRLELLKFWYSYLPTPKILIKNQAKNLDPNIVLYNFNKSELQILSLVIIGVIVINFKFDNHTQEGVLFLDTITKQLVDTLSFVLFNLTSKSHSYSKLRKITIDLIGKGFFLWEKYFNTNKTILSLFQTASNLCEFLPNNNPSLSSGFDITYIAHKAILQIADKRTPLFLNIIIEEINNYKINPNPNLILDKSKSEIMFIINYLIVNKHEIITEFLIQVIDIMVFCIDGSHLKFKQLNDLVPSVNSFPQIHHCVESHKIAVGLKTGSIAIYELKNMKYHLISAHKEPVNCVKFSPDGKILCSFSYKENCLSFWLIFTTIFSFGNIQVKFIRSFNNCCKNLELNNDFGKLVWTNNKIVILMFHNGTEARFQV